MISGWNDGLWDQRGAPPEVRPAPAVLPEIGIALSRPRGLGLYRPNDLYDFTRLWLGLRPLRDARRPGTGACKVTVFGLIGAFARFVDRAHPDEAAVADVLLRAGLPMERPVVLDEHRFR